MIARLKATGAVSAAGNSLPVDWSALEELLVFMIPEPRTRG